jgi:hypothetical protein
VQPPIGALEPARTLVIEIRIMEKRAAVDEIATQ